MNDLGFLIELSLSGALLSTIVYVACLPLKKHAPPRLMCCLWLLVLLRFCLPLPSPLAHVKLTPAASAIPDAVSVVSSEIIPAGEIGAGGFALPLGLIWALGAAAAAAAQFVPYFAMRRRVLRSAREADRELSECFRAMYSGSWLRIAVSSETRSPMIMGLVRPVLVVPDTEMRTELRFALKHELEHHCRGDIYVKWLAALVKCLHWFNPAAYLASHEFARSCEFACDAAVVRDMPREERRSYGETLLRFACGESQGSPLSAGMSRVQAILKERLVLIMKYKRHSASVLAASAALLMLFAACAVLLGPLSAAADTVPPDEPAVSSEPVTADDVTAPDACTEYVWPLPANETVTSPFGTRIHPVLQKEITHNGMDILAQTGDSVVAAAPGTVESTGFDTEQGNFIIIDHGGFKTLYAQLSAISVDTGDVVEAGQAIGAAGSTGASTGPHLHFGLIIDGGYADPAQLFVK